MKYENHAGKYLEIKASLMASDNLLTFFYKKIDKFNS